MVYSCFEKGCLIRESSFNMKRGEIKILRRGLRKFLGNRKGGSEKN